MAFSGAGLIINPNAPRVGQPVGTAPYGPAFTPAVTFGSLADRNQSHFAIGAVNGGLPGMTVDLACHHVVGWDVIWGFWNALINNKHYDTARDYLAALGIAKTATNKLEQQIKNNSFVDTLDVEQTLCWKPVNIVRGPNDRSDDPNANTTLASKIDFQMVGKHLYKGRIPPLVATGRVMVEYIGNGLEDKAIKAVQHFKTVRNEGIMEWDETLWAVDKAFPQYSNAPAPGGGFNIVRPKWRVHTAKI